METFSGLSKILKGNKHLKMFSRKRFIMKQNRAYIEKYHPRTYLWVELIAKIYEHLIL